MTDDLPFLTADSRRELTGLSLADQFKLERTEPWIRHWSARYGGAPKNIRNWLTSGRPRANRDDLAVIGDRSIVAAVRSAVARMPECVAHFIVGNAWIRCSGVESIGWCHTPIKPPCAAPIDVLVTRDDENLVAHELMHAFQRHASELRTAAQCNHSQDLLETDPDWADVRTEVCDRTEIAADSLGRAMGFDIDVVGRARARRARAATKTGDK